MRDRPDGVALLGLARAVLLDELLPELPEAQRYAGRMVANAIAVAARELAAGTRPLEAERAALAALYEEEAEPTRPGPAREPLEDALERLTWRLAAGIRGGARDADPRAYAVLLDGVIARLRETNPRALEAAGLAEPGAEPAAPKAAAAKPR